MKKLQSPRRSRLRRNSIALACLVAFLLCCAPAFASTDESLLFSYINNERDREGLQPLEWDDQLHEAALAHSRDMARTGAFGHVGSDGSLPDDRARKEGVFASKIAENVAKDLTVASVHTSLMQSLAHRKNILDPEVTHGAVGIVRSGKFLWVTEMFAKALRDYSLDEGRKLLLSEVNHDRQAQGLAPLSVSERMTSYAQSHIDLQEKVDELTPPMLLDLLAKQMKGSVRVNVYTTGDLNTLPDDVVENVQSPAQGIGIGLKRVRGTFCPNGCYLVVLIFGPADEKS